MGGTDDAVKGAVGRGLGEGVLGEGGVLRAAAVWHVANMLHRRGQADTPPPLPSPLLILASAKGRLDQP